MLIRRLNGEDSRAPSLDTMNTYCYAERTACHGSLEMLGSRMITGPNIDPSTFLAIGRDNVLGNLEISISIETLVSSRNH